MKFQYPKARKDESVVDNFHGTEVTDPYRWMEDPDATETKAYVDAQNAITLPYLDSCPIKQQIKNRVTETWDYAKYTCPKKHGSRYFYYHNTGLQNQSVLFVQDSLDGEARVFLDPNSLSPDGTTSISGTSFSKDGCSFAYGLSKAGSDWVTIKFKDIEKNEDFEDALAKVKFSSMAWTHDGKGLFYNVYPEAGDKSDGTETMANMNQKLYYHRMGDPQEKDVCVVEFPEEPKWMIGAEVTDCGRYLIITVRQGCDPVNRLFFSDLQDLGGEITGLMKYTKVVDNFDGEYEYITNDGSMCTFKTNLNAPRYKLINIDFNNFAMDQWTSLVEEDQIDVLEWVACVNTNKLILCYLHNVKSTLYVYDLATGKQVYKIPLDIGSIVGYSGEKEDTEIFYQFMSFLSPGTIYHCDMSSDTYEPKVFRQITVKDFDATLFEQKQVFFTSKDGTQIPMFIVHRKGLELDSSHPVLLYGYGGFNISITPTFSVSRVVFMRHLGGVLAVANIRGGGEYGENWHKGGTFDKKQNVFDDFQGAAEYLIDANYTCAKRITINGGSNGGLLVAVCANQRPDLFGCVIDQVGVHDMLRFHKFTIGHAWITDFGCADDKEHFGFLFKYSPLHNVPSDVNYPATLLLTADHDDRVVPLHSLKFIATVHEKLGECDKQVNPLLIRVDTKAGHGAGKPTAKVIEEVTEIYGFIALTFGLKWKE